MSVMNLPLEIVSPLGPDALRVESLSVEEHLSGLFHIEVAMTSHEADADLDALVGQEMTIRLQRVAGPARCFHGLVTRLVQGGRRGGNHHYRVDLFPRLWLLTLSSDYRIFQRMTVPDIVGMLLTEHEVTDVRMELTAAYVPREFCVQYGETAFDFISRLMEEEGIFYFFEHEDGAHTLVLGDDAGVHPEVDPATVPLLAAFPEREVEDTLVECGYRKQLVTGGAVVLDYNFETPATPLAGKAEGTSATGMFEAVEHPGRFATRDAGDRIAKLRSEAFQLPATTLSGSGYARAFSAGFQFRLAGHPRDDLDQAYVLRQVHHTATMSGYANSFEAFPVSAPFRPPLRTPKPRILGAQTAVVVGPAGEKIHTDRYGRVKVQFHWDRRGRDDEESSCWIRVAQDWAGKGFGTFFLPRVGQEVLVSFLDGDVDRPIVSGSVYNAVQVVPYALPTHQTRSVVRTQTEGEVHNELRFEDHKDVEEIWIQAAKDFKADVVNDRTWTVKHDSVETVKNDRTATVEEGNEKLVVSKGNRTVEVGEGNETLTVKKGNRTVEVQTGDETHRVKGKRTVTVTGDEVHQSAKLDWKTNGDFTLKVTGNVVIEATGSITLKAGTDVTVQAANNLTNKGLNVTNDAQVGLKNKAGATLDNEAGAALNNKSSGMQTVEASGILNVKSSAILNVQGTLVKIN